MLLRDLMKRPDNSALQEREFRFNGVRVDCEIAVFPHVLLSGVSDCFVIVNWRHVPVTTIIVSHNDRAFDDMLVDFPVQVFRCHTIKHKRPRLSATFDERHNTRFVAARIVRFCLSRFFSADISFIHFHYPFQVCSKFWLRQRVSNPVRHKERRAVAAETENLICKQLMPFFDQHIRYQAMSHFRNGMCESSKIVPTVTVNCLLHSGIVKASANFFFEILLNFPDALFLSFLQCGQTMPNSQRISSRYYPPFHLCRIAIEFRPA